MRNRTRDLMHPYPENLKTEISLGILMLSKDKVKGSLSGKDLQINFHISLRNFFMSYLLSMSL